MTSRIGILGFAHGHVNSYCRVWREQPELGIAVTAGWDHDAQRLAEAVSNHGIEACATAAELLEGDDLDAVVIAAETSLHADLTEQAAAAGKTVVLQKPIALTMAEADRIVHAVQESGIRFSVAWQMRCDPQNRKMKELVDSGVLGKLFMVRRNHGLSVCLNDRFADSWHVSAKWNRDIFADDAAHAADFILWMLGEPESVTAEIASLHNPAMPMDNGIVIFRYPGGPLAEICCSFTNRGRENTTEILGENGSVIQNYGDVPGCAVPRLVGACGLRWYTTESGWQDSDIPSPQAHGERIADLAGPLAEFIRGTRDPIATAEQGRAALRMILACYVSVREGRRVPFNDSAVYEV